MGIGRNLFHLQVQMATHTQYFLIDLPLHFLLLLHDGFQTSLSLRPDIELIIPAAAHINAFLDHLAYLANSIYIPFQVLQDFHDNSVSQALVLQPAYQISQGFHHTVYLH